MPNLRDASSSINGYVYQRYYAIFLFLKKIDENEEPFMIMEEGIEDVDLTINNKKYVYQLKYHGVENKGREGLSETSNLFKSINSDYIYNDEIEIVYYDVYNVNNKNYTDKLEKCWIMKENL